MPRREQRHHARQAPAWRRVSEHHLVRSRCRFGAPFKHQVVLRLWQVVLQRKKPAQGRLSTT
jgi:hypothetical protein